MDESGSFTVVPTPFSQGTFNAQENADAAISANLPGASTVFPTSSGAEFADFYVRHYFNANNAGLPTNDTSYMTQHFGNFYSYDDGSAEIAYGIPETGAKIAYRFDIKKQDTLIGAYIYFNQVGEIVHNHLFQLCYWDTINTTTNTDHLVYNEIDQHPANIDSINGFAAYIFQTPQIVPAGPMYIGWIQNDNTQLGIGVDKNTIATSHMFTKYTSGGILKWRPSIIQGAWMMRPIFRSSLTGIGIDKQEASAFAFNVFPNPASTQAFIDINVHNKQQYDYEFFNNIGERILVGNVSAERINISGLPAGFYFVRVTNTKTNESVTKKLVIQHP
jgi:hypothetical protein